MKRKIYLALSGLVVGALILAFILFSSNQPQAEGYLELLDVKDEKVGIISCKIFHVGWHGRKTELKFTLYKRTRVAGHAVPGYVTAQWNQTNGNVVSVKDGNVCAAKDGDIFKLSIPIFAAYIRISYDNKTMHFSGTTGKMEDFSTS